MSKKLTEIRNDILKAVQAGDELGAKFAINDLDTYITKQNRVKCESISGDIGSCSSVEEMICKLKFPNEDYDPNDFNDWAKENENEAYKLCLKIATFLNCR
jgi:hypothetical protein|tara:strand:+ start:85 stop:387 length:303 start_codon:yes stop_codon:yes gene_type:complete